MNVSRKIALIICIVIMAFNFMMFSSYAHKKDYHDKGEIESKEVQSEKNIPNSHKPNENLNKDVPESQQKSKIGHDNGYSEGMTSSRNEVKDFLYEYIILILGVTTAISFFVTVTFAHLKRRFRKWIKYHHFFAQLTGIMMIIHATLAILLHYFL